MPPAAWRTVCTPHTSIESAKLFAFAWDGPQVCKRVVESSDLVGSSIAVDLLQRRDAPLNGEGAAVLLAVVLHIPNYLFLCGKHSSRERWKLRGHY